MSGVRLFIFIICLPLLAAIGHDIYLFVTQTGLENTGDVLAGGDKPWHSYFATAGWIWTSYSPDTFRTVAQSLEPDEWKSLNVVLGQKAVVLGGVFAAFWMLVLGLLKLLKLGPFRAESGSGKSFGRDKTTGRFIYKRK